MRTLFDTPNPPTQTLLDELEIIDTAMLEGEATEEQERRGLEIVTLCDDAPRLKAEVERLTKELERKRTYCKELERDARKARRELCNYKELSSVYMSIKQAAEADAQLPYDDHYRECLWGLQEIAADQDSCTCNQRGWQGEGHHSQCAHSIAAAAIERADAERRKAHKTRHPENYQTPSKADVEGGVA